MSLAYFPSVPIEEPKDGLCQINKLGDPSRRAAKPRKIAAILKPLSTRIPVVFVFVADPILQEPLQIKGGPAIVPDRPGNGLAWKNDVVARYQLV